MVENVHVSYIVWGNSRFDIRPYTITDGFIGDYGLVGPTIFDNDKDYMEGLAILCDRLKCIGGGCQKTCISYDNCQNNPRSNKYDGTCVICAPSETYWEGKCMQACSSREKFVYGKCLCLDEFQRIGN